jgi:CheY-like chemotaxis protein/nitrogen-specific signal transduction histidine kinase
VDIQSGMSVFFAAIMTFACGWCWWQRQRLVRQLAHSQGALMSARAAVEARGRFLANMSHEIRTPLNGILGFSTLLERELPAGENRQHARFVREATESLTGILNDILDFSRIESGNVKREEIDFDLHALVESCTSLYRLTPARKDVVVSLVYSLPGMPYLKGDPGKLRQILQNLLSNAIRHTDSGSVTLSVASVEPSFTTDRWVEFTVRDTGRGIPPYLQNELFTRYSRVNSDSTHRGAGLGLAIVKGLVESLKGRISLESTPGVGTTVNVSLPFSAPDQTLCAIPQDFRPAGKGMRILVADDIPLNRLLIKQVLKRHHHDVYEAVDGSEVIRLAGLIRFDLILMDIGMPVMNGLDCASQLQSAPGLNRHTPIVAVTGHAFDSDRRLASQTGMSGYLAKPIVLEELLRVVESFSIRVREG